MKVGDILKKEIKGIPSLQYPYKIIINYNCKYPYLQKLDNFIFLENCNTFMNEFPRNKLYNKHRNLSQKKVLNKNSSSKNFCLKTDSDNLEKYSINHILNNNLPLLRESKPRNNIKISQELFNECTLIRNKIKRLKSEVKNLKNIREKSINSYFTKKQSKAEKFIINSNFKNNSNNKMNKTQKKKLKLKKIQDLFEYRIHIKFKNMNNIIDKLNTPLFIYNRTETN